MKKKLAASQKINPELNNKKINDPKGYWTLLKSFSRNEESIPIEKSIFLEHFKKLNSVSTPSHNDCNISYEDIDKSNLNKTISLDEENGK